jgi:DNA-binding PadR family transcriptional regulator
MNLPTLSHLQFAVLDALGARELKGRELRAELAKRDALKSAPAFYQLMSRLEQSKFVEGEDEMTPAEGYALRERRYRITGVGERARRETLAFYAAAQASALPFPA